MSILGHAGSRYLNPTFTKLLFPIVFFISNTLLLIGSRSHQYIYFVNKISFALFIKIVYAVYFDIVDSTIVEI